MYLVMKLLHIVVIIATGIATAVVGGLPLPRTGWILWTFVLMVLKPGL